MKRYGSLACDGTVNVIAYIEDHMVIDKILTHLDEKATLAESVMLRQSWAPPHAGVFDRFSVQPTPFQETAAIAVAARVHFVCCSEMLVMSG